MLSVMFGRNHSSFSGGRLVPRSRSIPIHCYRRNNYGILALNSKGGGVRRKKWIAPRRSTTAKSVALQMGEGRGDNAAVTYGQKKLLPKNTEEHYCEFFIIIIACMEIFIYIKHDLPRHNYLCE